MKNSLSKSLNLIDAIMIVAGSMIGSGIFVITTDIARNVHSEILLLVVWLIAGIMTVSGTLCYGKYATSIPKADGQYAYTGSGLAIVLSGIPVYYIWKKTIKIDTILEEPKESVEQ